MTPRATENPGSSSIDPAGRWSPALLVALAVLFVAGIAVRVAMWPARGLIGDLDQFVLWVHGIAVDGWGRAYDQNLSFPAVMAWVWGALAAVEPAFRTVTDSSDAGIRALMKVPASLADLGVAAGVVWWFRDRPRLAVVAAGAILLWPATWYVSAWWGQYEPIFVLPALLAVLAARAGRPGLVAVLLAVSLMTKPQALPFAIPFAAWFLATQGWRGTLRAAVIGAVVALAAWLPFIPAGGPLHYLDNLRTYQNDIFSVLSLNAWNPWWLFQQARAGGLFIADSNVVAGPITYRHLGLLAAGLLAIVVFVGVYRRPTVERLALGLAAISMVAFVALTTMHERYAYPAVVFLLLGAGSARVAWTWLVLAIAYTLNLVVVVPPEGLAIRPAEPFGVAGALLMTAVTVVTLAWLARDDEPEPRPATGQPRLGSAADT